MRAHLTTLLVILLGMLVGACGTQDRGVSVEDDRSLLAAAPAAARQAGTAHLSMRIDFQGTGVPEGAGLEASGQVDFAANMLAMDGRMSGVPEEMASFAMILTPDAMYMQMFPLRQQFGVDWLRMGFDDLADETGVDIGEMLATEAMDPTAMLDQLAGVTDDIEVVGQDTVRGVATTHYRATIDREAAVEAVPESSREAIRALLKDAEAADQYPVDVWLDADGLLRRQVMNLTVMGVHQILTFETFDYGTPVDIVAPTDSVIEYPDWVQRIREMNPIPG